ncbi:MAG: hypothetical protein MRQ13_02320 [Candidatus Midichloria sp.]|nr:hypothetical protein [Candidatus Midichloria sp.]
MIALNQLKAAEDQIKEQTGTHVYHYEKVVYVEGAEPDLAQGGDSSHGIDIY